MKPENRNRIQFSESTANPVQVSSGQVSDDLLLLQSDGEAGATVLARGSEIYWAARLPGGKTRVRFRDGSEVFVADRPEDILTYLKSH